MARLAGSLVLLAGLVLVAASCQATTNDANTFLLRSAGPDVVATSDEVTERIFRQLQTTGALPEGYPVRGHVVTEPDPADPGVERMSCAPGTADKPGETRCILLSQEDDFIRVQPITWQSAALFMYRVYIAPDSLFARVDPTRDFVAIDVFALNNAALWGPADQAIRSAATAIGARPFRP
jgi:hypothetical protein